jgi:tetratricopeptide (TPR) repeat protein
MIAEAKPAVEPDGVADDLRTTRVTARPGYRPPWMDKSYATQMVLQPLSTAVFERGLALCQSHDLRDWLPTLAARAGYAYTLASRLPEALTLLEQAVGQCEVMRGGALQAAYVIWLGEAYLLAGRLDEAYIQAQHAPEFSRAHQERCNEAYALRLLGEVAAQRHPQPDERAAAYYRQALPLAQALGMRPLVAHCHRGLGTLYATTGQAAQARTALSTAIEMYRSMEMTLWLPQTDTALTQVEKP